MESEVQDDHTTTDLEALSVVLQAALDDCALALFNDDVGLGANPGARPDDPGLVAVGFGAR